MRLLPTIALGLCCLSASAQRFTVLLDPARGGTEDGAHIDEHTTEKQVTLDLANRLRALLNARDFNVVVTRDADVTMTNDARAAVANQSKPVACLLLHATAAGKGLHLFTSALPQVAPQTVAVPWDEAQAPFADRSQRLEGELSTAFGRSKIAVSSGRTWVRPLDNMQCPAVAIEIAPDGEGATAADHGYQNRIAETIAGALLFWRGHADVMQSILTPVTPLEVKSAAPTTMATPAVTVAKPTAGGGPGAGAATAHAAAVAPKAKPPASTAVPQLRPGTPAAKPAGTAGVAPKPTTTGAPLPRTGIPEGKAAAGSGGTTRPSTPQGPLRREASPPQTTPRGTNMPVTPQGAADPNSIAPVKTPRVRAVPVRPAEGSPQ